MQWVAGFGRVYALPEAVRRLHEGTLADRACCITFDDGYANNCDVALPILRELGLTATIFIATDAVDRGVMWNDLVIEAVRRAGRSIRASDLAALGMSREDLRADSAAVDVLLGHLKYRPLHERWDLAVEFYRRVTGMDPPRLMMTRATVRAVAHAGFDIGAHTVNHPILKTLAPEVARQEIGASRDWITNVVGSPPAAFAYPNGRPGPDYDDTHVQMVRDAGFSLAVSTSWGCAARASDAFQLPRVAFWDRTRVRFWLRMLSTYAKSYRR